MSVTIPAAFTAAEPDGVEWEFTALDMPGGCDQYDWCGGLCKSESRTREGGLHTRLVASGWRPTDFALIEVSVAQWKADPKVGLRDTGTAFAPNRDKPPLVGVFTYPAHLAEAKRAAFKVSDAAALAEALRIVGHVRFADAMDSAVSLARRLEESKR